MACPISPKLSELINRFATKPDCEISLNALREDVAREFGCNADCALALMRSDVANNSDLMRSGLLFFIY
jgi:hypothetical protein